MAVVRGVEVEVATQDVVHPYHLAREELADAVVVNVGKVAVGAIHGVVARLSRDNIEDIDRCVAEGDVPLRRVGIIGGCGHRRQGVNSASSSA